MVLYYHLLAHPLFLVYSTIFYWHIGYPYDITLSFSDPHAIPLVLFYLLLAHLLSLWYSTIFFWPTGFPCGTLLSFTGSQAIPMILFYLFFPQTFAVVLYYLLPAHWLFLLYSTIFFWPTGYPYGTLLSSTDTQAIPMIPYIFYWPTGYRCGTLLSSSSPVAIPLVLYYHLLAHRLSL